MRVKTLTVSAAAASLRDFLAAHNYNFAARKQFYQLTEKKREQVLGLKQLVVRRKSDGALLTGDGVRAVLGLADKTTTTVALDPTDITDFDVFVASAAATRKVAQGTDVLVVVDDADPKGKDVVEVSEDDDSKKRKRTDNDSVTAKKKPDTGPKPVEVFISFDTTGSMWPCLSQVRRNIKELIHNLFQQIPGIRIAVMAQADYGNDYVTEFIDLSVDEDKLCDFVTKVESCKRHYDVEECYELVLHEARTKISWSSVAQRAVIVIGDAMPHGPTDARNLGGHNWRTEAKGLQDDGVRIYSVQALEWWRSAQADFWEPLARDYGGVYLKLAQFNQTADFIRAICYNEHSTAQLTQFHDEIKANGRMNRSLHNMFSQLLGNSVVGDYQAGTVANLTPVPASRFQVLQVDAAQNKMSIKDFAEGNGLTFKTGRGFYEFTKPEKISAKKEVVLMDKVTGDMFTGQEACELIGAGGSSKIQPATLDKWRVFVQSTSVTRGLVGGSGFLYEVDGS